MRKARLFQGVLVALSALCAIGAGWIATQSSNAGVESRCGPILSQRGFGDSGCDDFYASHLLGIAVLLVAGVAAYAGSSIVERVDDRRSGRRPVR